MVERLITLTKQQKNNDPSFNPRVEAQKYLFETGPTIEKLFSEIGPRFQNRNGGYTRVLKLENRLGDNSPQSILELVGGSRDMRRAITARVVARHEVFGEPLNPITQKAVNTIVRESAEAKTAFEAEVETMKKAFYNKDFTNAAQETEDLPPVAFESKKRAPIRFVKNPLCK